METGPDTVVDRGSITDLGDWHAFVGTFRYWKEPTGRMLYLYDDVSNLVGRIVNPESVVLLSTVD